MSIAERGITLVISDIRVVLWSFEDFSLSVEVTLLTYEVTASNALLYARQESGEVTANYVHHLCTVLTNENAACVRAAKWARNYEFTLASDGSYPDKASRVRLF